MLKKAIRTIFLMCVLLLIACGAERDETKDTDLEKMAENNADTGTGDSVESKPEALTGELTLMVWLSYARDVWQPVADAFMEEHPGVTIKIDAPSPEDDQNEIFLQKYNTRIMTGDGFDIVDTSVTGMEKYGGEQGLFVDLYELMDADKEFRREDYFSCIFEPMETDGKLYELVYSVQPLYVWLNKRLLGRAGLEYTEETISFIEMYELYEKVRESEGERIFLTDSMYGYEGMSAYEDGYFVRNNQIDSDEFREYLKMRHELYYTSESRTSWSDGTIRINDDVLCRVGDALRLPYSNLVDAAFTETEDVTGAVVYEGMHGERYFYNPDALAISSFSENKELAWEFLKFVVSNRESESTESSRISPNREKVVSMCEGMKPEVSERLMRDIELIDTAAFRDSSLSFSQQSVYDDYFLNNTITAEECCKELASRVYLYMNE